MRPAREGDTPIAMGGRAARPRVDRRALTSRDARPYLSRVMGSPSARPGGPVPTVVVEDDPIVAEAVRALLAPTRFATAAVFGDAEAALAAIDAGLRAEIAIVDLGLPGLSGTDLVTRLAASHPGVECVVFTVHDDDAHLFGALRAGAVGYLLKTAAPATIVEGLEQLVAGGAPMSAGLARRVLAGLRVPAAPTAGGSLTAREVEVLDLLARGFTYGTIGRGLGIAVSTVQAHIKSIYRKLEVGSKAEATSEGYRRGLLH